MFYFKNKALVGRYSQLFKFENQVLYFVNLTRLGFWISVPGTDYGVKSLVD